MADPQRTGASQADEAPPSPRQLAAQFAAHLRHLREFRGLAYVSAAPSPRRESAAPGESTHAWSSGQVSDVAPSTGESAHGWSEGQVNSAPPARDVGAPPRSASEPPRSAGEPPWSQSGAPPRSASEPRASMRAAGDSPRPQSGAPMRAAGEPQPQRAAPPPGSATARPPGATPQRVDLPIAASGPPRSAEAPRPAGEGDLRAQAQTWTPAEKLAYLRSRNIGDCTRCKLAKTRTNIVFGVGDPQARLMFVGEAPGADEDRRGEPFVGAAGRRLTQWIERLGMRREQVYIANVLKCRPPGNRDPVADEVEKCAPFLRAQIRAIRPEVLIALGRHAGMFLLGGREDIRIGQVRGRRFLYDDAAAKLQIPLFITYHPSYVIRREGELAPGQRNPADDTVMADLERAARALSGRAG